MYKALNKSRRQMVLIGLIICMITVMSQYNYNEYMQGNTLSIDSGQEVTSEKHESIKEIDFLSNRLHKRQNPRREEQSQLRESNDISIYLNIIVSYIILRKIMFLEYIICFIDQVIKFIQAQDGTKRKLLLE